MCISLHSHQMVTDVCYSLPCGQEQTGKCLGHCTGMCMGTCVCRGKEEGEEDARGGQTSLPASWWTLAEETGPEEGTHW